MYAEHCVKIIQISGFHIKNVVKLLYLYKVIHVKILLFVLCIVDLYHNFNTRIKYYVYRVII